MGLKFDKLRLGWDGIKLSVDRYSNHAQMLVFQAGTVSQAKLLIFYNLSFRVWLVSFAATTTVDC